MSTSGDKVIPQVNTTANTINRTVQFYTAMHACHRSTQILRYRIVENKAATYLFGGSAVGIEAPCPQLGC